MSDRFMEKYADRLKPLDNIEVVVVEEGNCIIKCPNCRDREIQVLEDVVSVCPGCNLSYTMKQINLFYEVEEK